MNVIVFSEDQLHGVLDELRIDIPCHAVGGTMSKLPLKQQPPFRGRGGYGEQLPLQNYDNDLSSFRLMKAKL